MQKTLKVQGLHQQVSQQPHLSGNKKKPPNTVPKEETTNSARLESKNPSGSPGVGRLTALVWCQRELDGGWERTILKSNKVFVKAPMTFVLSNLDGERVPLSLYVS